jgi:putative FmdB family regulatory protein
MPTYEYECENCGLKFERRQAITEPPIPRCPECLGRVQRLISGGAGFILRSYRGGAPERECSLERAGKTCCGREERCSKPPCRDE